MQELLNNPTWWSLAIVCVVGNLVGCALCYISSDVGNIWRLICVGVFCIGLIAMPIYLFINYFVNGIIGYSTWGCSSSSARYIFWGMYGLAIPTVASYFPAPD
jgi:hypothetical protein